MDFENQGDVESEGERGGVWEFLKEQRWWVLVAVLLVSGALLTFALFRREVRRQAALEKDGPQTADQLLATGGEKVSAEVYFRTPDMDLSAGDILAPQSKAVLRSDTLSGRARQIVLALVEGPDGDLRPVLPKETKIRRVYLSKDGLAVVDLSKEARDLLVGGVDAEASAAYAITNSLHKNIPEIRRVRILIEGLEQETWAGHLSLRDDFEPDLSLIK